jgi:hypothetical protein
MILKLIQRGYLNDYAGGIDDWFVELAYHYGRCEWIVDMWDDDQWQGFNPGTKEESVDFIIRHLNRKGISVTHVELLSETDVAFEDILLS